MSYGSRRRFMSTGGLMAVAPFGVLLRRPFASWTSVGSRAVVSARGIAPRLRGPTLILVSLGLILISGEAAYATSFSWNVGSGDWFTATNWSPNGVPGAADDVVISNGGTCTLDAAASITNFT